MCARSARKPQRLAGSADAQLPVRRFEPALQNALFRTTGPLLRARLKTEKASRMQPRSHPACDLGVLACLLHPGERLRRDDRGLPDQSASRCSVTAQVAAEREASSARTLYRDSASGAAGRRTRGRGRGLEVKSGENRSGIRVAQVCDVLAAARTMWPCCCVLACYCSS